jgi:hypothetical protein
MFVYLQLTKAISFIRAFASSALLFPDFSNPAHNSCVKVLKLSVAVFEVRK